jgi:hypothetical protein
MAYLLITNLLRAMPLPVTCRWCCEHMSCHVMTLECHTHQMFGIDTRRDM